MSHTQHIQVTVPVEIDGKHLSRVSQVSVDNPPGRVDRASMNHLVLEPDDVVGADGRPDNVRVAVSVQIGRVHCHRPGPARPGMFDPAVIARCAVVLVPDDRVQALARPQDVDVAVLVHVRDGDIRPAGE